jgi:hypothetical protein
LLRGMMPGKFEERNTITVVNKHIYIYGVLQTYAIDIYRSIHIYIYIYYVWQTYM